MTLPDVARLAVMPPAALHTLRDTLRNSGYDARFLSTLSRLGERLDDRLRLPLRIWHLRRRPGPAALFARLFFYGDSVARRDLDAFGGELAPWIEGGLLDASSEGVVSRWRIAPFHGAWLIGDALDHGGDAVMAAGGLTSILARAVLPVEPDARCLDLGCGAGALAVTMAATSRRVMAVDINPRAVALTRVNASLNGVSQLETAVGDLFEPLRGARFDRIVSQPPFLPQVPDSRHTTFLHGGSRGDELAMRVLAETLDHLDTGGRAYVLSEWPIRDDTLAARMRESLGPRGDLTLFLAPNKDVDGIVAHYAAASRPALDAAYRDEAIALRDHVNRAGIRALATGLVVLRAGAEAGRTETVAIRHPHDAPLARTSVDEWLDAIDTAYATERLATTPLELPPGATMTDAPAIDGNPPGVVLRPTAASLIGPIVLSPEEAAALRDILETQPPRPEALRHAARRLILRGVLVPSTLS